MKQIIQDLKNGETVLEDVPVPKVKTGHVLIKTTYSLVSLGTERMLVEFGKSNYIEKARQQPDKVKQVLDKIKTEGLLPTVEAVFNKLDSPLPLGYCNVGRVIAVGNGVSNYKVGDRVASNGNHAEYVCVPENLVIQIPNDVSDIDASFTVIASIGLQGIRLVQPTMGETVVVTGLGLIGLITIQLLRSSGCNVIGLDFDSDKVSLAKKLGIDAVDVSQGIDPVKYVMTATDSIGADAVIITASSKSDEIIAQAAQMSRKRGRIVLVGVIGLNISRADFYEKELSFQVSCSYGPGRYDDDYELNGQDYPLPFVRWTENRNFKTVLNAINTGSLDVKPLISEIVKFENYLDIYGDMRKKGVIASILEYGDSESESITKTVEILPPTTKNNNNTIAIVGAGNFTQMTILPCLKKIDSSIKYIISSKGLSGTNLAKKYNINYSSTDYEEALNDTDVDTVMITTRHDLHAQMVISALDKGKNVFVEKPLALNIEDLVRIEETYRKSSSVLTVGFNRRFSPFSVRVKSFLGANQPLNIIATMNAGMIPRNVWVHDMKIGGGRIIGEACHFIDLMTYFTDSKVRSVHMSALGENPEENTDNAIITVKYENGSQGVINYFSNGSKSYPKERIEIYSQDRTFVIDNWRKLSVYGIRGFKTQKSKIDKGHISQFKIIGGTNIHQNIPVDDIFNTTRASFAAIQSLKEGKVITL